MWALKRKKKIHPNTKSEMDTPTAVTTTTSVMKNDHFVRKNGWSSPFHPLQLVAWFFLIFFSVSYFIIMIPNLPTSETKWIAGSINGFIFTFHIIIYMTSTSINPADNAVIEKYSNDTNYKLKNGSNNKIIKPAKFDRSKHQHVIENQFCYICEVSVSSKAKHCSACNKCVSHFDHHCKWLNNCVGGKNYK